MYNMYRLLIVDGTSLFQKNGTQYQLANLGGSRLCTRKNFTPLSKFSSTESVGSLAPSTPPSHMQPKN